jgi:dTDP-glucose 4,6-dehydratase
VQNILVTGGAGFIGSNFIRYLLNRREDLRIFNLDLLTYAGHLENLADVEKNPSYHFIKGDINDSSLLEALFYKCKFDTVIHFAAESHVDRSIVGPAQFVQTNIVGTFNLLEAAKNAWLRDNKWTSSDSPRFHHVSTDEVFGSLSPTDSPFSELTPYFPRSPYSASKAASDHLVNAYFHTYGLPITISNCTNNYGPYQFPEKLIPLLVINAVNGKSLPVYGDGKQIRDWLYVEDHCDAIYRILENGRVGETYLIGGNNQPTNLEIVMEVCTILDRLLPYSRFMPHSQLIQYVADRPGHDRRYAMNIQKIHSELGWFPKESIHSGLEKTVHWYLSHGDWIQSVSKQKDFQDWIEENYGNRGNI